MSNSSIYETKWTNLVFENKNKEYGAYQLRQENSKTTITALFMALLLIATIGTISMLISKFRTPPVIETPTIIDEVIRPVTIDPSIVQPKVEPITPPDQQATAPSTDVTQLVNPVVVETSQATPDVIATNAQNTPAVDNSTGNGTAVNTLPTTGGQGVEVTQPAEPGNSVLNTTELDKMPEFPGGMSKFYTYVGNNFTRPELDAERTLKVYVSFVIEKDGSITDIMVRNDPGYGVGKEAIRVLKSLKTKWSPGILNGKPVRTAYNLPITIKTEAE